MTRMLTNSRNPQLIWNKLDKLQSISSRIKRAKMNNNFYYVTS